MNKLLNKSDNLLRNNGKWPYLVNVTDHASAMYGTSYASQSKRVTSMAFIVAKYCLELEVPPFCKLVTGKSSFPWNMKWNTRVVPYMKWSDEEAQIINDKVQLVIPGNIPVLGSKRQTPNQVWSKSEIGRASPFFLNKWCLQNSTAYYWLGLSVSNYNLNCRKIGRVGMSPFESMYGFKAQRGISHLPRSISAKSSKEDNARRRDDREMLSNVGSCRTTFEL